MIDITTFEVEHFDKMEIKSNCWADNGARNLIEAYKCAGPSWTLWVDGKIILCGGLVFGGWPGIADVWLVPSRHIGKHSLTVVKKVKALLNISIKHYNLHRVQATIMAPEVHWIEMLGFAREGLLRKFGPNKEDKYIYARVE